MALPRIVVVQAEGFPEIDPPWLPVGVAGPTGPEPGLAVVVKATFHYGGGELRWAGAQEPLSAGEHSPPGASAEVIAPDAPVVIEGLSRGAPRFDLRLPGLSPVVTITAGGEPDTPVPLRCDTLWIDAEREILTLTWRGEAAPADGAIGVSRIAVSVEHAAAPRADEDRLAAFQRGGFGFALAAGDGAGGTGPRDEEEQARLTMARYQTWASKAPPPRLALPAYARLAALLAERPDARGETLAHHGLDEDRFAVEERAWLERMAREAGDGDVTLAAEHARLLAEAQREVAEPVDLPLQRYADLRVALDGAEDPGAVLRGAELSIPQWMRADAGWSDAAAGDPAIGADLEAALAAARAAAGEARS